MPRCLSLIPMLVVALLAGGIGYLVGTSPSGVTPPHLPSDSPVLDVLPWPAFRVAVTLNNWLSRATKATTPPHVLVMQMITSRWQSHALYALVKNDILEATATLSNSNGGSTTCRAVAQNLSLHEHGVCEYMRAGVHMDLLDRVPSKAGDDYDDDDDAILNLSVYGQLLLRDTPKSMRDIALLLNGEITEAWKAAESTTIREGQRDGFSEVFGTNFFAWHTDRPELEAQFDRAMTNLGEPFVAAFVAEYPFPPEDSFVFCDVGGGVGTSAALVLEHYPKMSALVMDRETVAPRADVFMARKGLQDRAKGVAGSFYEPFPEVLATCDMFFLKYILHDWSDENGIQILANIKKIAKPGSKVVIMENVLGTMPDRSLMEFNKALMSLNMYATCPWGARERSLSHFVRMFEEAGYTNKLQLLKLRDLLEAMVMNV